MSEIQENSFDDLQKLSEQDLSKIQNEVDSKEVKELKNVISNLDEKIVKLTLFGYEEGNDNYNYQEMSKIYNDFKNDVYDIINDEDGIIDSIELTRLESINKLINVSTFSVFGMDGEEFHEIQDKDIDDIKSIKQLVYSREILDRIGGENSFSINDLKSILGLIEDVGSSNIDDKDLGEINQLITDIFDEGIDRSDIERLQKLQVMLLVTYNVEQNQKYENFSLDEYKVEGSDKEDIKETKDLLNSLAELDNEYGDRFNEIAPTMGNFLDSVAIEIKEGLIEGEWNTLGSSLRLVLKQFADFQESFNKIDFSDPVGSGKEILDFQIKLAGIDKYILVGNAFNVLRHSLPTSVGLLFTSIKEIKNYYLQSTGPESEHGVFVQEMHMYRDEIKDKDYTNEFIQETSYIPDLVKDGDKETSKKIKEIASFGADSVDNIMINSLSVLNGGSDAVLDFSGVLLNTLLLPEKTFGKLINGAESLVNMDMMDGLKNMIPDNLNQEQISKSLYLISYICMYIAAVSVIPGLGWANDKISGALNSLSKMIGKPVKSITDIVEKGIIKVTQTEKFQKLNKLAGEGTKINDISKKAVNNIKQEGGYFVEGIKEIGTSIKKIDTSIKDGTSTFLKRKQYESTISTGALNHLDSVSGKTNRVNDGSNRLQKIVDKNINKAA